MFRASDTHVNRLHRDWYLNLKLFPHIRLQVDSVTTGSVIRVLDVASNQRIDIGEGGRERLVAELVPRECLILESSWDGHVDIFQISCIQVFMVMRQGNQCIDKVHILPQGCNWVYLDACALSADSVARIRQVECRFKLDV